MKRQGEWDKDNTHLFKRYDLERSIIHWWDYVWLAFYPMRTHIAEGFAFHFKVAGGKYYIMKYESIYDPLREEQ